MIFSKQMAQSQQSVLLVEQAVESETSTHGRHLQESDPVWKTHWIRALNGCNYITYANKIKKKKKEQSNKSTGTPGFSSCLLHFHQQKPGFGPYFILKLFFLSFLNFSFKFFKL